LVPTTSPYSLKYCFYCHLRIPQPAMMVAALTFLLCSLVAASAAALYYPRPFQQAEIQYHYTAPARGCVEIKYYNGGVYYRSYICDGSAGMCLKVTTCLIVTNPATFEWKQGRYVATKEETVRALIIIIISNALHGSWSLDIGSM